MNISTAMMVTVTLTMTAVMVPRIYLAWVLADAYCLEGEVDALRHLLAEQNRWIGRQFFCGSAALAMLLMVKLSPHDLSIPAAMTTVLGVYSVIALLLAVFESLVAQKAYTYLRRVPVCVKVDDKGKRR